MALKTGNVVQGKVGSSAYTTAADTVVFELPSGAMITGVKVFGTASNDTGTATLTFKNIPYDALGTPATFATVDVKTALSGVTGLFAVSSYAGVAFTRLPVRNKVSVTYTGQNANASAGAFTFVVEYL
jgi:hypothetical protein